MKSGDRHSSAFDALESDPVVAQNLKVRSELMMALEQEINKRGLTQKAAAETLGVSQPRVSDLMKGRIDKFSIDMLINMLATLGRGVSIRLGRGVTTKAA